MLKISIYRISGMCAKTNGSEAIIYARIERNLKKWVRDGKFLEAGSSMSEVAEELEANVDQMRRFFMIRVGMSFLEWRTQMRLEVAKKMLLTDPQAPIEAIAINIGMNDKSNFWKLFLQKYNMTPTAWREKNARRCKWSCKRRAKRKKIDWY